jgi:hypothetical protein
MPLSSRTCELSTDDAYAEALTLCREASPVRTSAAQESESESGGGDQDYTRSSCAWWARYDRDSSWWRMSQGCILTGEQESFSGTWPASGTMRSGTLFQPVNSERHICDGGCSLWPTPDTQGGGIAWTMARQILETGSRARKSGAKAGTFMLLGVALAELREGRTQRPGRVNPLLSEWLMGWRMSHTALDAQAMEWFRSKPRRPGKDSKKSQKPKRIWPE